MPGDAAGTMAHQMTAEGCRQQVAQAGRDCEVALGDRVAEIAAETPQR
jgi:hypothetical protein